MCKDCESRLVELAGSGIYAACKVGNAIDIYRWSRTVLGPHVEAPEELHATVAYSTQPFDVTKVPDHKPIKLGKNSNRRIGRLGDMIVLFLDETEARPLHDIWKSFIDQGASWSHPSYVCHISLAKQSDLSDGELADLNAYEGPIFFHPPYIDALRDKSNLDEEVKVKEVAATQLLSATAKKKKIAEIKALIEKFETARSDRTADKYKKQIYDELEEFGIKREEVGLKPLKTAKTPAVKKVKEPSTGVLTRDSMILEIKNWIKKYERTSSDTTATKLQKQIYDALDEWKITRSEVGLPEKKTKAVSTKSVEKTSPLQSTMPLTRLPLMPITKAAAGSKATKVSYLKELWKIINAEKFASQMHLPNLDISKAVKVERFRRRGVWFASTRRLAISPHLFNNEALLYETLTHEMCHQAVSEITKLAYREQQGGHGPVWASWMVKVGLNPKRFNTNENSEYMTEEERLEYENKEEKKKAAIATEERLSYVETGMIAKFLSSKDGTWKAGIIGLRNDKAGKRWAFAGLHDAPGRWMIVPTNMFYKVDPVTEASLRPRLEQRLREVTEAQQRNSEIKASNRAIRKSIRGGGNWDDDDSFARAIRMIKSF